MADDHAGHVLDAIAAALGRLPRSPIMHYPSERGLEYEDVTFPSADGVPLEGWFIPAPGSDRLVIVNHPMYFARSGLPSHLEPWKSIWGPSGNDIEVDFTHDLAILHHAGYNVLTYDLRSHGLSGTGNGGIASSGIFEARDVLGSLSYVAGRPDTRNMAVGLFSRCLGFNATLYAMTLDPGAFANVRCLAGPQPVTEEIILGRVLAVAGVRADPGELERRVRLATGIGFAARDTQAWAKQCTVPTYVYQVRDDVLTVPEDVQTIFDNIPATDKRLSWIEDSTARWDGYLEFQRRPGTVLDWFAGHLSPY
ncbi:alpha/beta hydrolase [Streptomyces sp. PSAA01]|uniref:alpha/beta hydrolase n=1 Tax=Streptomyces sp. PSAA01 TaxID=2912762 RepID=UPI001F18C2FD|nr:lysophospholipase [Streptomyces sp. PSAA01]MCG0289116.1 lysophospholipase [Streptomyces sp. PSAA01]